MTPDLMLLTTADTMIKACLVRSGENSAKPGDNLKNIKAVRSHNIKLGIEEAI